MKLLRPHLFVGFVLAVILSTGVHVALQNALTSKRFEWLSRDASGGIVLVAIDSSSLDAVGVWPWPRTVHADLIDRLVRAGATDIVFDVDFSSASNPASDQAFEDALRRAGGSIVLPSFKQMVVPRSGERAIVVDRPLPRFADLAWEASVNIEADPDGVLRRYPFGETLDGTFLPSVGAILAGSRTVQSGSFLIDFGIRAASVPRISAAEIRRADPAALAFLDGKKVIVGGTALELGDRVQVPVNQTIPGALLQILAAESILQDRVLRRTSPVLTLVGLAAILTAMQLLWRRRSAGVRVALLVAGAGVVEAAAVAVQAAWPLVVETIFLHAALAAYLVTIALDEIDLRGFLGLIAEKRFQRIAMSIGDGLVCLDRAGVMTVCNPGVEAIFGFAPGELVGRPFDVLLASSGAAFHITDFSAEALTAPGGKVVELEGRRRNGDRFPIEACLSAWPGADGLQYGAVLRDISVRRREEERIRYLARYDTLTGLPNRNTLYEALEARVEAARTNGFDVAVLMFDLDGFKDINDTLGHTCGDAVLCEIAGRLAGQVGELGLAARLGGDEFAVVLSGHDAVERAERLSVAIASSFMHSDVMALGHSMRVSCSIGIAVYPRDSQNVHEILADADLAMFRAKADGGGRHVRFDRIMRGELEKRIALTGELERAAAQGEFELFFQPQIRLSDGHLEGAEALIRWRHPERGLVSPAEFIPVLDTMPLADKVSLWVMQTACRQARAWQQKGHAIRIGVNLSPVQFKSGDLVNTTAAVLAETGLPASLLELEVTESILLADDERALEIFRRLRDLGVHLAWDDFGTGYASLNYLKKFPLNRLKVDQQFVRHIEPGSNDAAIVDYTIRLAGVLGMSVIAEGVETAESVALLAGMGCHEGQGYHFSRPLPAADFERMFFAKDQAMAWGPDIGVAAA